MRPGLPIPKVIQASSYHDFNHNLSFEVHFRLVTGNADITHAAIAQALSITSKTAERATKALRDYGLLRREGSDKTGKWIIVKSAE